MGARAAQAWGKTGSPVQLYLPIAEVSVNIFVLLGLGGMVGFLSGMFGVGGGFLITPLLFFIGIPPVVAVATGANQVVASSISGVLAQFRRRAVDLPMGVVLTLGGFVGSGIGGVVFDLMTKAGQIDLFVQLSYVLFLGLRVAAISTITNMAAGLSDEQISHEHTKAMAPLGAAKLEKVLRHYLRRLV